VMWIGVMLYCSSLTNIDSCQALVRNKVLFKTEAECRATVPREAAGLLKMYGGKVIRSKCLPLPQLGQSV
jgi:hypothetical protein